MFISSGNCGTFVPHVSLTIHLYILERAKCSPPEIVGLQLSALLKFLAKRSRSPTSSEACVFHIFCGGSLYGDDCSSSFTKVKSTILPLYYVMLGVILATSANHADISLLKGLP